MAGGVIRSPGCRSANLGPGPSWLRGRLDHCAEPLLSERWRLQFYCNGHGWLAQRLTAAVIGFILADNAFLRSDDWEHPGETQEGWPLSARRAAFPWQQGKMQGIHAIPADLGKTTSENTMIPACSRQIPYAPEKGIKSADQGI